MTMEWALGETQDSLTPGHEGAQAHPWLPHTFVFVKPRQFWHLRCSGDGLCRVWWLGILPWPAVTWKTENKAPKVSSKYLTANMQICKSPQAINELIPNLVQNKEKQLLSRVLQLPCNQDFNAQTRKAQRRRGCQGLLCPFCVLDMQKGLQKLLQDAALCCSTESCRSCHSQVPPRPPELLWHLQPEGMGRVRSGRSIHNSVHAQISTFPLNCSTGITQWCCSCLLGSGVIKMIN